MATLQKYSFKGLNLRDSDVNKDPEYASDLQNVLLNSKRELIKRYGYDEELVDSSILDVVEYISGNKLIFVKANGLYEDVAGTLTLIPFAGDGTTFTGLVDHDEYNGVLYIADTTGNNFLYKYDGYRVYRAGMPQVTVNSVTASGAGAATNHYYRVYFVYADNKGSYISGDFYQTDRINLASQPTFNIDTLLGTEFPHDNFTLSAPRHPIGIIIFFSDNETYGYRAVQSTLATGVPLLFSVDHTGATDDIDVDADGGLIDSSGDPMEDYYDTTIIKGLPPKAKYFKIYGETSVMGNKAVEAELSGRPDSETTFYWSDTGVGSTVETYPPFNKQAAGKTTEGDITGLFAGSNEFIIFKESQVYYINGILIDRAFRLTSSLSAGIGCTSHKSIVESPGGCFFQSSRGIYFAGGGIPPLEISDLIEPLFTEDTTGLDFSLTRGLRDTKNEKLMFFIPATSSANSIVLVYDYYYKEWFKFKSINAAKGFVFLGSDLYHCDGTTLFKRNTAYNDDGSAINAFYKAGWNHLGAPSLLKKFSRAIIQSIGSLVWACNIKSQKNYADTDDTNLTINFTASVFLGDKPLNMSNAYSLRLVIGNNVLNEGMLVTGYEIEYSPNQKSIKGND